MKRPGATLDAGCVIAKLHLDDPSRVQQVSLYLYDHFSLGESLPREVLVCHC